jgi:hypothetical protein
MTVIDQVKISWEKLRVNFEKFPSLGAGLVFVSVFLLYASVYLASPGFLFKDDHFFHFKYAYLIRTQGWTAVQNFRWIPINLNQSLAYPLTLFNLALIPFTYFKNLELGLKISDIFWASLSVSTIYWVFRKLKLKGAAFWILALVSVIFFAERMLVGRALVLVPAFLMLELYFAKEKKYFKFFFVSLLQIVWHPATLFFPVVMALLVEAARILAGSKFSWKSLPGAGVALLVGLKLISFDLLGFLRQVLDVQLTAIQKANSPAVAIGGSELYPVDLFKVLESSEIFLLLLLVCFGIVIFCYVSAKRKKAFSLDKEDGTLVFSAFLFALMSLVGSMSVSGRLFDYYFVAVVFLAASVATILLKRKAIVVQATPRKVFLGGLTIFFLVATLSSFLNIKREMDGGHYRLIGEVATWVGERSNENEKVFLDNWSFFPVVFFYNSKNFYNTGLEPEIVRWRDAPLYWKWYNILVYRMYCDQPLDCATAQEKFTATLKTASEAQKQQLKQENSRKIIESIKNDFGAHFVIVSGELGNVLDLNPDLIIAKIEKRSETDDVNIRGYELK